MTFVVFVFVSGAERQHGGGGVQPMACSDLYLFGVFFVFGNLCCGQTSL